MRQSKGFSLVEALVVGIIGSIIAGIFIAFMYVHNDVVNRGVARGILHTQSETVSKTIGTAVRNAGSVFAEGEGWQAHPSMNTRNTNQIELYDHSGTPTRIYRIGLITQRLYEGPSSNTRYIFTTGKDTVTATLGSLFKLSPDRKRVTLDIGYTINYRGKTYSIPPKKDTYLCRN